MRYIPFISIIIIVIISIGFTKIAAGICFGIQYCYYMSLNYDLWAKSCSYYRLWTYSFLILIFLSLINTLVLDFTTDIIAIVITIISYNYYIIIVTNATNVIITKVY